MEDNADCNKPLLIFKINVDGNLYWKAFIQRLGCCSALILMIQASCTGKRWITELIKKLWAIAWDQ